MNITEAIQKECDIICESVDELKHLIDLMEINNIEPKDKISISVSLYRSNQYAINARLMPMHFEQLSASQFIKDNQ